MAKRKTEQNQQIREENGGRYSLRVIIFAAVTLFLELCLFDIFGKVGGWIRYAEFGLFGLAAYIIPIGIFLLVLVLTYAKKNQNRSIICGVIFFLFLAAFLHLVSYPGFENESLTAYFTNCAQEVKGGGIIGGTIAFGLTSAVSLVGAYIVSIIVLLVCLLLICEVPFTRFFREFFSGDRKQYYEEEPDEEPDKIVRPSGRKKEQVVYEEPERERGRSRARETRYPDEDFEEPVRRRRTRSDEDELIYETTAEDGVVIRIVQSRKPHKRKRAELKRTGNKAASVRDGSVKTLRSQSKAKGIGENVQMQPLPESVDEIREITAHPPKKTEPVPRPEPERAEAAIPAALPHTEETLVSENVKMAEKKPRRQPGKPAAKSAGTASSPAAQQIPSDVSVKAVAPVKQDSRGYMYPPMSLLAQRKGKGKSANDAELDKVSRNLEVILSNFGVAARVIDRQAGPSVTRYELQPEMGTRVSKITALEDDLKLNLAVSDIRIEAPIPGRAAIGIEIPNKEKETVLMRELLEAPDLINHKSKIAFAAGVDISGEVIVADIAKMPHLLVAGTTGSGKSTFINTIIMALLYRARPDEVGLIIIDPKKIEFGVYSGIPHLVKDVVTDPGQAVSTLRWAVNEMTNRYQRMQLSGVRDFKSYNEKFDKGTLSDEEENPKKMPQIVIIIDELADLMMVASKEAEALICRLAQLARAAGIHLIIATQRPSVDVVTGLIKANIPARVALLVASQVDSRTIIDMKGAEELLGYGDMLFYPTGYSKPVRVQGAFVSEDEVANVVGFLKQHKTEDYFAEEAQQIAEYMNNAGEGQMEIGESPAKNNSQDEYLFEAGKLCIEMGKASSSMLQRHFSVGFNRAAKIIDQLTEMGAISPPNGAKPREILVDLYTFEEMFQSKQE